MADRLVEPFAARIYALGFNVLRPDVAAIPRWPRPRRWHAIFASSPDAIAYTSDDLRAYRVYDGREWKYEDTI